MNDLRVHLIPLLLVGLCSATHGATGVRQTSAERASESFETSVRPIVKSSCGSCHSEHEPEAGLNLLQLKDDFSDERQVEVWQRVLEQLVLGAMPPSEKRTAGDVQKLADWITKELRRAGQPILVRHKLRSPAFGNHVNHERLFDGTETGPASSPARLWRLSPHAYDDFVDDLGRGLRRVAAIHQPFSLDAERGTIIDFAALQFADDATLQLLMMNCRTIVNFQTTGVVYRDHEQKSRTIRRVPPVFQTILDAKTRPTNDQVKGAIVHEFQLVLERAPTPAEVTTLAELFRRSTDIGGPTRALKAVLTAILLKPEAIYRWEVGLGPVDKLGRHRLSREELAFALARALTDNRPSEVVLKQQAGTKVSLLDLSRQGGLETADAIRRVVVQILDQNDMSMANYRMFTEDHGIRNTRVVRFFREFFGYDHAPKVFKDAKRIGFGNSYLTERMVDDADQLVMHIFDEDRDVLRRLLTTDKFFVAYLGSRDNIRKDLHYIKTNKNDANFDFNTKYVQRAEAAGRHPIPIESPDARRYVDFYNLDHETWDYPTEQPFRMPPGQRAGILTHPAWLIAWSGNFDNDPIRRGKWIREHLLAEPIPDVPLDVNASVPDDRDRTLRDRLNVTRSAKCWKCHHKMDPLGLPFEAFDDFGRYRTHEVVGELLSIFPERHARAKTVEVDSRGEIIDAAEQPLNGPVHDVFELVHRLAESQRVRQSFVRHAFRYWMGRNETLDDSPTLIAADAAYVENGGSMKALIALLLSSDSFLYRKPQ